MELEFGVDLTIGPPIEEGFYYDCSMGDATLNDQDLVRVEKRVSAAIQVCYCVLPLFGGTLALFPHT